MINLQKEYNIYFLEKDVSKPFEELIHELSKNKITLMHAIKLILNQSINRIEIQTRKIKDNVFTLGILLFIHDIWIDAVIEIELDNEDLLIRSFSTNICISQRYIDDRPQWYATLGFGKNCSIIINDEINNHLNRLKEFIGKEEFSFLENSNNSYAGLFEKDSLGVFNITYNFILKNYLLAITHYNRSPSIEETNQVKIMISRDFFSSSYPNTCVKIENDSLDVKDFLAYSLSKELNADFEVVKEILNSNSNIFNYKTALETINLCKY